MDTVVNAHYSRLSSFVLRTLYFFLPGVICLAGSMSHEMPPGVRDELLSRLRRAEGQLRGIQKMITEERGCQDVLIQLAAVKSAVVQTAMTIIGTQLTRCVKESEASGRSPDEAMERFMEVFKKFS